MEPIELNGKTFCSNCGLTIGAAGPYVQAATISPFSATDQPEEETVTLDVIQPTPREPQTPIKDITKGEYGLPVNEPGDLILSDTVEQEATKDTPEAPQTPINVTVNVDTPHEQPLTPEETAAPTEDLTLADIPKPETEDEGTVIPFETPEDVPPTHFSDSENENIPPFGQSVVVPNEAEFETAPTENVPEPKTNAEKIKEVDTLGASGILLDILNENYQTSKADDSLNTLTAAEEILEEMATSELNPKNDTPDILAGKAANPLKQIELTSPLEELELTSGPNNADLESATIPETTAIQKDTTNEPAKKVDEEVESSDLYKLPHELETTDINDANPDTKAAIDKVEEDLAKLTDPEPNESDIKSKEFDPDTLAPLEQELPQEHPPVEVDIETTEEANPEPAKNYQEKQAAVTSFFKQRVEGTKKPAKNPFKASGKTKSAKNKKKTLPWMIIIASVSVTLAALLIAIYYFAIYNKPVVDSGQTTTVAADNNFSSLTPTTIPDGYEMTSSDFDQGAKKLSMKYAFVTDESKTLLYTQSESTDTKKATTDFIDSKKGASYLVKDEDGITFTEFTNGDLVWTKDNFIFTIETANYDFAHDLLYKMALSIG